MNDLQQGSHRPKFRHWAALGILILFVAAVVLPPLVNIGRYQHRIVSIVSQSVGRPVRVSSIRLRLLPRPGFVLNNLVLAEDPTFGYEPVLRAQSVTASIRLTSLWRGQLEIARISFDEPSINLVENNGRWNLESLILKAAQAAAAPTTARAGQDRPRFPYIEASNARVNIKRGVEKLPYSLLNADLSFWLDQPDDWRWHVEAQPARTDLRIDMADTGKFEADGHFHRATSLQQMPLLIHAEWSDVQLGQFTRLVAGNDTGWRGGATAIAEITGTPENLALKTRLRATGVHRTEFEPQDLLNLDANCTARYLHPVHTLNDIHCQSPIGKGNVEISGSVVHANDSFQPNLKFALAQVPAIAALDTFRSLRNGFAPGMSATGVLNGSLSLAPPEDAPQAPAAFNGSITATGVTLTGGALHSALPLPDIEFHGDPAASQPPALILSSFPLAAGSAKPILVSGRFTSDNYLLQLSGQAQIDRLNEYLRAFLPVQAPNNIQGGEADLNLQLSGPWVAPLVDTDHPIPSDRVDGSLAVHDVNYAPSFLASPIEVSQAHASLSGDRIHWDGADIHFAGLRALATFDITRLCANPVCPASFLLRFASLNVADLQTSLMGARKHGALVEELLSKLDRQKPASWPPLEGSIEAGTIDFGTLAVHDARAALSIRDRGIDLRSLDGRALGGRVHLSGTVDASGKSPAYSFKGGFLQANAAEAGALFHQHWGTGQLNLDASVSFSGFTQEDMASSAKGESHWEWSRGSLAMPNTPAALTHFDHWQAHSTINGGTLSLADSVILLNRALPPIPVKGNIRLTAPPVFSLEAAAPPATAPKRAHR